MELDIDFSISAQYGERHESYSRNLKVFRSFVKVFGVFFKKEKYQNAEIKIEEDANHQAIIRFCGKHYHLCLKVNTADPKAAVILLLRVNGDKPLQIGTVAIADSEGVIFPPDRLVLLKDSYDFNNAVLKFFIDAVSADRDLDPLVFKALLSLNGYFRRRQDEKFAC